MEHSKSSVGPIVLFDGVCNLCNGFVRFLFERDRRAMLRFGSIQSASAAALLDKYGYRTDSKDSIFVIHRGTVLSHSDAVVEAIVALGGRWRVLRLVRMVPRPVRDWIYRVIARSRYRLFGRSRVCMVPPQDWESRFIDTPAGVSNQDV